MHGSLSSSTLLSTQLKKVEFPEIGMVAFRRSLRARRLTISIKPARGVMVTIPGLVPFRVAYDFVNSKREWINSKLSQLVPQEIFSNSNPYRTRSHTLKFIAEYRVNVCVKITEGYILISYPSSMVEGHAQVQEAARRGIDLAYRMEAHTLLPQRLARLASRHGISYNRLSIKKTHTRWGSCSSKKNINLSIYLMKLPNELIDYIILHELAHIKIRNHQQEFWGYLETLLGGNAKNLAKSLKLYRPGA